ncbi:hypothetical protein CDT94_07940 [Cronobacter sakazakii]|nr:hypothetical protein CDT94_07940 [Cronobacter sakazakii]PUY52241.1 hypothetical protein CEA52_20050 [Cronobacter sakazakii]
MLNALPTFNKLFPKRCSFLRRFRALLYCLFVQPYCRYERAQANRRYDFARRLPKSEIQEKAPSIFVAVVLK